MYILAGAVWGKPTNNKRIIKQAGQMRIKPFHTYLWNTGSDYLQIDDNVESIFQYKCKKRMKLFAVVYLGSSNPPSVVPTSFEYLSA